MGRISRGRLSYGYYHVYRCGIQRKYAPSEPHGEGGQGKIFSKAFPLHNNERELIDYFVSHLESSKSIRPVGVEFKRE